METAASFLGGQAGGPPPPPCPYIAGFSERRPLDAFSIWRKIPTTNKRRVRVRRIFKGNGTTNERSARVRRVWRTTNERSVRVRRKCPRTTNKRTPEHSHRTSPCGTAAQELVLLYFPSGLFVYSWISRRFVFSVTSVRPILFSRHAINRPLQTAKYEKEKVHLGDATALDRTFPEDTRRGT